MKQEFFRVPDLNEKKIVADYERKHNKKEQHAGIRITVGLIVFLVRNPNLMIDLNVPF